MKITLNIGLIESHVLGAGREMCQFDARRIVEDKLKLAGANSVTTYVVHDVASEPTLVAHVKGDWDAVVMAAKALCVDLVQDCIAVGFVPTAGAKPIGVLVGPRAAAWGGFAPEYFKVG